VKVGDLVTLSTYALQSAPMWSWRNKIWKQNKNVIGIIINVENNPHITKHTSDNEKKYYFVRWMPDGPAGRWNNGNMSAAKPYQLSYFFRKDLKFVK